MGNFDTMGNSWGPNGDQRLFTSLSAPSKQLLGWVTNLRTIYHVGMEFENQTFEIGTYQKTGEVLKIELSDNEYLLIENRQAVGVDSLLYGGGILIWHVDYSYFVGQGLPSGELENSMEFDVADPSSWGVRHPAVRLIQADKLYDLEKDDNYGDSNDFFGSNPLSDSLSDRDTANINEYANFGTPSNLILFNFSISAATMTFSLSSSTPTTSPSSGIAPHSRTANPSSAPSDSLLISRAGSLYAYSLLLWIFLNWK